jgi:hypothetical protein
VPVSRTSEQSHARAQMEPIKGASLLFRASQEIWKAIRQHVSVDTGSINSAAYINVPRALELLAMKYPISLLSSTRPIGQTPLRDEDVIVKEERAETDALFGSLGPTERFAKSIDIVQSTLSNLALIRKDREAERLWTEDVLTHLAMAIEYVQNNRISKDLKSLKKSADKEGLVVHVLKWTGMAPNRAAMFGGLNIISFEECIDFIHSDEHDLYMVKIVTTEASSSIMQSIDEWNLACDNQLGCVNLVPDGGIGSIKTYDSSSMHLLAQDESYLRLDHYQLTECPVYKLWRKDGLDRHAKRPRIAPLSDGVARAALSFNDAARIAPSFNDIEDVEQACVPSASGTVRVSSDDLKYAKLLSEASERALKFLNKESMSSESVQDMLTLGWQVNVSIATLVSDPDSPVVMADPLPPMLMDFVNDLVEASGCPKTDKAPQACPMMMPIPLMAIRDLKEAFRAETDALRKLHDQTVFDLRMEIQTLKDERKLHDQTVLNLRMDISTLKDAFRAEIKTLGHKHGELERTIADRDATIARLRDGQV